MQLVLTIVMCFFHPLLIIFFCCISDPRQRGTLYSLLFETLNEVLNVCLIRK